VRVGNVVSTGEIPEGKPWDEEIVIKRRAITRTSIAPTRVRQADGSLSEPRREHLVIEYGNEPTVLRVRTGEHNAWTDHRQASSS